MLWHKKTLFSRHFRTYTRRKQGEGFSQASIPRGFCARTGDG